MRRILSLASMFVGMIAIFVVFYLIASKSLETQDTGALYGGRLEFGYPSAGYLQAYTRQGYLNTCGFSVLNASTAVTAAHCVDDAETIEVGKGSYSRDSEEHVKVVVATQKQGWVQSQDRTQDFAILNFVGKDFFTNFAEVISPEIGCNYRVVAYGRTEDPNETFTKPRKSANVCIQQIDQNTFQFQGKDSGLCFGDSGSPIYLENSEQLVGVVVSIIKENDTDPNDPCNISNRGIAVRPDINLGLINETQDKFDPGTGAVDLSDPVIINVVGQSPFGGQGPLLAVAVVAFAAILIASFVIYGDLRRRG